MSSVGQLCNTECLQQIAHLPRQTLDGGFAQN